MKSNKDTLFITIKPNGPVWVNGNTSAWATSAPVVLASDQAETKYLLDPEFSLDEIAKAQELVNKA